MKLVLVLLLSAFSFSGPVKMKITGEDAVVQELDFASVYLSGAEAVKLITITPTKLGFTESEQIKVFSYNDEDADLIMDYLRELKAGETPVEILVDENRKTSGAYEPRAIKIKIGDKRPIHFRGLAREAKRRQRQLSADSSSENKKVKGNRRHRGKSVPVGRGQGTSKYPKAPVLP